MDRLKQVRKGKGITLVDLSTDIGIPKSTLSRYENGESEPKKETWQKLANYFNVSVAYLMGFTETAENKLKNADPKFIGKLTSFIRKVRYSTIDQFVELINERLVGGSQKLNSDTYKLIEDGHSLPTLDQASAIASIGGYSLDNFIAGLVFHTYDYDYLEKVMENAGFPINKKALKKVVIAANEAKAMRFSFADIVQMHAFNTIESNNNKIIRDKMTLINYLKERREFLLQTEQDDSIPNEIKMDIIIESSSITEELNRQNIYEETFSD